MLSAKRLPELPDTADHDRGGLSRFPAVELDGHFWPGRAAAEIRDRLAAALVKVGKIAELQTRIRNAGTEPVGSDAPTFAAFVDAESKKWKAFVDRTGVRLNP